MKTIGTSVTIIDNINKEMCDYVPELKKFKGKSAKITGVMEKYENNKDAYFLDIDNGQWLWYDEYFK
jgi:phosphopantothenate synthetase